MPYTRPSYNSANADFSSALVYTLPSWNSANATFVDGDSEVIIWANSMLGSESVLASASVIALVSASTMLGDPAVLVSSVYNTALVSANTMLGAVSLLGGSSSVFIKADLLGTENVLGSVATSAFVSGGSPLGTPSSLVLSDIGDALLDLSPQFYAADITTPTGVVRLKISSWTASLEVDKASYIGFVVPGCTSDTFDLLGTMTAFSVMRYAMLNGAAIESLVASAVTGLSVQSDSGPTNTTATVAGYTADTTYPANDNPNSAWDRTLTGVRSVSIYASGLRVRATIDWMLKPGQRAFYSDGGELIASRIVYNANVADSYMDVTEVING